MCTVRETCLLKAFPHSLHLKGFLSPQTPGCVQGGVFQGCCSLAFLHQHGTSFLLARSSAATPHPLPCLIPPGPCRQPLARFPSYSFLKDNRPRQAEWEVSSDVYSGSRLPGSLSLSSVLSPVFPLPMPFDLPYLGTRSHSLGPSQ